MGCTLWISKETKTILLCLLLMQKGLVLLDNGQYILKMKLCLPLLLVHKNRSPDLFKGLPKDLSHLPGTPHPLRRLPDDVKQKRESLTQPSRRRLHYEEDDEGEGNKENQDPKDDERRRALLGWLLDKWAEDIIQYQEQVLQDLNDLKQRLQIPRLSL
uniref:E4 protein n=1 Tax=Human papillomavirus TaxID=10566 RepID=A0A385PQM8_9PAPI|nr:MAG: E4 protein [Human papillomavirus]